MHHVTAHHIKLWQYCLKGEGEEEDKDKENEEEKEEGRGGLEISLHQSKEEWSAMTRYVLCTCDALDLATLESWETNRQHVCARQLPHAVKSELGSTIAFATIVPHDIQFDFSHRVIWYMAGLQMWC